MDKGILKEEVQVLSQKPSEIKTICSDKKKHSDHRYIDALLENNSILIEEIYLNNAYSITCMIKKLGGTQEDTRDVFQEALIKLLKQARAGFILSCPLNAFLKIVCRNIWLNKKRKEKRIHYSGKLSDNIKNAINDFWEREEQREQYEKAFYMLTKKEQELWNLCWTINPQTGKFNTNTEVAHVLHLSPNYVTKKKCEIRKTLQQTIKNLR